MRLRTLLAELFALDHVAAGLVVAWFGIRGLVDLAHRRPTGRRVAAPSWRSRTRRVRGLLGLLGSLAVVASFALAMPVLAVGAGAVLIGVAAWDAIESVVGRVRVGNLVFALLGFVLAVFFTGFRD